MSFSVDQFMQVKCKFTITSETESAESIYTNNEQVRLCKSVQLDASNNSTLIVMVCSNDASNNHILAYYIERPQSQFQTNAYTEQKVDDNTSNAGVHDSSQENDESHAGNAVTFTKLAQLSNHSLNNTSPSPSNASYRRRSRTKPRIIVKQIYYHNYNEDIVAICLNQSGTRLVLINASSTIYIIPIKNILLNIHAQQLRTSQCGSMYYYDASILNPCAQEGHRWSINEPIDVVMWESSEDQKSTLVVANQDGKLTFISVDDKREICSTSVGEPIRCIEIIHDGCSHSLLITCESFNQYRQVLESKEPANIVQQAAPEPVRRGPASSFLVRLPKTRFSKMKTDRKGIPDPAHAGSGNHLWASKPIPVKTPIFANHPGQASSSRVMQRVFTPSASHLGVQTSLSFNEVRDRPLTLLGYQSPNLISLIDVLGPTNNQNQPHKFSTNQNLLHQPKFQTNPGEPRLIRFYSSKHYFHQPHRPQIICRLDSLDPDELIMNLILTDRFIAYTTDRDRCIISSRNCCKLKSSSLASHALRNESLNPLVKEITFNHEEKIMLLVKSPITNDQDKIIDSFLLVTTRSVYSIEARHNCRELFINLIDSHLAIKRTLFMSKTQIDYGETPGHNLERLIASNGQKGRAFNLDFRYTTTTSGYDTYRNAESNLLINNFLQHREVYERICHDSQAFSALFKLELSSLYEAYADRLLQRGQLDLANRFFQMASFDHVKILGKYIRVGNYREAIDYVKDVLNDENDFRKVMTESEKIEISKMAFECLLAKTVVERSKDSLFKAKLNRDCEMKLLAKFKKLHHSPMIGAHKQPPDISPSSSWTNGAHLRRLSPFDLCEHSPRGQDAKLSATTIVPLAYDEDEETLTSNTGTNSSALLAPNRMTRVAKSDQQTRLECERALIDFAKNLMPASMYEYTIDQLLDFDLIDIIDTIAQTDAQILSFLKMVIRYREEDRLIFRLCKLENLTERLNQLRQNDLAKVNTRNCEFLEFLISARVNRALVKDISLTCDFYGYQHTLVQFRKYSFAALRQLETLRQLVQMRKEANDLSDGTRNKDKKSRLSDLKENPLVDDDANDGMGFKSMLKLKEVDSDRGREMFNEQQKQIAENIFVEFLIACLDESTDDSCRLWFNYINYYLNYIGNLDQLQVDILRMIETIGDCRIAISLYKAIHRDESITAKTLANHHANKRSHPGHSTKNGIVHKTSPNKTSSSSASAMATHSKENMISNGPLETMEQLYNLDNLFRNEFLVRLLERTLDLLSQSVDLDALSIATMC